MVDGLTLIGEFWREIGVRLFVKPQDRTVLRNRSYAGLTVMVAAPGLDNAIPTAIMPPTELAPMRQDNYAWPKWGQYVETKGKNGEAVDIPEAKRLLDLYTTWMNTGNRTVQQDAWREMLRNHAENQWVHRHHLRRAAAHRGPQRAAGPSRQGALQLGADGDDRHLPAG